MRRLMIPLAAGIIPTVVVAGLPGGFLFALFLPLPLFLVGLGLGTSAYYVTAIAAFLTSALLSGIGSAAGAVVSTIGPVGLLVHQALRSRKDPAGQVDWYPAGLLVGWLTLCGVIWLMAILGLFASMGLGSIEAAVRQEMASMVEVLLPQIEVAERDKMATFMAPLIMGMSAGFWMLIVTMNGALAQLILVRRSVAIRPTPDLSDLTLSPWLAIGLGVSLAAAIVGDGDFAFLARNLVLVFAVPFLFGGLGVVHALCARLTARRGLLIAFYVLMVFLGWVAVAAVSVLGLVDQWVGLRRHLRRSRPDQEEE